MSSSITLKHHEHRSNNNEEPLPILPFDIVKSKLIQASLRVRIKQSEIHGWYCGKRIEILMTNVSTIVEVRVLKFFTPPYWVLALEGHRSS